MPINVLYHSSRDFKDMKDNLIQKLLGRPFSGTNVQDCAVVAADVHNWFDDYVHAMRGLGVVRRKRFSFADLLVLNAYSICGAISVARA
jgi:hypothetical protein